MPDNGGMQHISEDTIAILLLCAPLEKRTEDAPYPLTVSEYADLADVLRSANLRPSHLLNSDVTFLDNLTLSFTERKREKINTERLRRLLNRGGLLALSLSRWSSAGIWIVSRADDAYPSRYKRKLGRMAPSIIYGIGSQDLMQHGGLAVVGSRAPDSESESYTYHVGRWAASANVQVVSGAARGVDEISMLACVEAGGTSLGVVADSLLRASTQSGFRNAILNGRTTLLSSFDPEAGFSVGNAMGRNRWVYALADQALVVACSEGRGGTWAGAIEALKQGVRVYVKTGNPARPGNDALVRHGAIPVPQDLWMILKGPTVTDFIITENAPMETAYSVVAPLMLQLLQKPLTVITLSKMLGLLTSQTNIWLKQLEKEGKVERKAAFYQAILAKSIQLSLFASVSKNDT